MGEKHVPLYAQLDDHLLQRRITKEARESERVLLDEIKILRAALQYALDFEDGKVGCVRNWIFVAREALEKTK